MENLQNKIFINNNEILFSIVNQLNDIINEMYEKDLENIIKQIKNIIISLKNMINENKKNIDLLRGDISKLQKNMLNKFDNLSTSINFKISLNNYNIGDKGIVFSHPHSLIYSNYSKKPKVYGKEGWICNECKNKFKYNISNFFCKTCLYDICDFCYEEKKINNHKIGDKIKISRHKHTLEYCDSSRKPKEYTKGNWICDECKTLYTKENYNFFCKFCLYDICNKCLKEAKIE